MLSARLERNITCTVHLGRQKGPSRALPQTWRSEQSRAIAHLCTRSCHARLGYTSLEAFMPVSLGEAHSPDLNFPLPSGEAGKGCLPRSCRDSLLFPWCLVRAGTHGRRLSLTKGTKTWLLIVRTQKSVGTALLLKCCGASLSSFSPGAPGWGWHSDPGCFPCVALPDLLMAPQGCPGLISSLLRSFCSMPLG